MTRLGLAVDLLVMVALGISAFRDDIAWVLALGFLLVATAIERGHRRAATPSAPEPEPGPSAASEAAGR